MKELVSDNDNITNTPTALTQEDSLDNQQPDVLCSLEVSTEDDEIDLSFLYRIQNLHKCQFKQRYIAGYM